MVCFITTSVSCIKQQVPLLSVSTREVELFTILFLFTLFVGFFVFGVSVVIIDPNWYLP